ncbi:hypothetical protein GTHT12_03573 [Geobacillus thermodenitrificans]|uniref:DUF6792 domain-containing protein n=1 Tax=Geobacillus thermodenitrificans TaxID=33940 RepID=UPI000A29722B|nr:DUF6792 domain-containing protein [Geobacillus thermodenitrificans]ARP41498.1 hypothetical protein GTHT12_03573 [Geobacillus thermodenitrificans]
MPQKLVLDTDLLRARIMALEYDHLTEAEIRRIYMEETGKEPPDYIKVYHSDDFKKGRDFGFDGTIVHFYDEKQGINQKYTITRGSEEHENDTWKPHDWAYNMFGILAGQSDRQYRYALRFDKIVTKKIQEELKRKRATIPLETIGMGHSLGGNLSQMLQLIEKRFDHVYVINDDAPPSVYQLSYLDEDFSYDLVETFNLKDKDFNAIYSLPPAELKAFAEEYYKKHVDEHSIHHLTAEEDLLYAVSGVRGFIDIGSRDWINTNDQFTSLKGLIEKIPDQDVKAIQLYFSQYADVYNEKGLDGVVQAMTGVDLEWIESLTQYDVGDYVWNMPDIVEKVSDMFKDMREKIPELLKHIKILQRHKEAILQAFVDSGFLTMEQKEAISQEVKHIEQDVKKLDQILSDVRNNAVWFMALGGLSSGIALFVVFKQIKHYVTDILARLQTINRHMADVREAAVTSVDAHSLHKVINTLARAKGREYDKQGNMILVGWIETEKGTKKIRLNISSAVRLYQKGLRITEEKEAVLRQIKWLYIQEYVEDFEGRKRQLIRKIEDMEQNPSAYQHLLGSFSYDAQQVYVLRRIDVHESIPTMDPSIPDAFEGMFASYEQEIAKGRELIANIKQAFEQFFEKDKQLANLFDLRYE